MLSKTSLDFLERFLKSSGPSGFEFEPAALYREYAASFADSVSTDVTGNTIACLNPKAKFKVMLAGHYDEIGFQVVYIDDDGFLTFRQVGGIDRLTLPGIEVDILSGDGRKVPGVIGRKPIHLQTQKERDTPPEIKDLWIDIGSESKDETLKKVRVGDPIAFRVNYRRMGNRIMSKGLDDKIGAFVAIEALKLLARRKIKVGVYAVGTVQEELGLRGAQTSAFEIAPDAAICVDVGFATDAAGVEKKTWGDVKLGGGPILSRNGDNNPVMTRILSETAAKHKISCQIDCGHRASGGTDTAEVQLTRSGVATALVSIPNRYMHTPVEICDIRDVEGAVELIAETIASFTGKEKFIPGIN
ncbi:MAG: putative aminopeptidase YsdC [Lentisphaerae bacterium ADurb.Bin242]|nr:MAG: putative aminopeptidase YsdC [Lentisphaerae bacterium ADurb.Bin242]